MAKNYTCIDYTTPGKVKYLIVKTPASNIQLVSLYKNNAGNTVKDSGYYGMNASFFNSNSNDAILNVAVQDGKTVGTGKSVPTLYGGSTKDGGVNLIGSSAITWNGTALNCLNNIHYSTDSGIPTNSNTWAQGGIGLYLCDKDWEKKYLAEYSAETYPLDKTAARTGILINKSTKMVYLFACTTEVLVTGLRTAMMGQVGLTEGGSPGNWAAIMTDGGHSTQLHTGEESVAAFLARKVPQMIALKNKT